MVTIYKGQNIMPKNKPTMIPAMSIKGNARNIKIVLIKYIDTVFKFSVIYPTFVLIKER